MKLNFYSKNIRRLLVFFSLFYFTSCVYFNTFYNAKSNYKKAHSIIDLMDYRETSIPTEAERLLNLAIANSRVVIEKHPNSRHVEEAYYLLGSSMFLKDDYISSKEYFLPLVEQYPDGEYFNEANLRLAQIELRTNNRNNADSIITELKNNSDLNRYENFLLRNIYAEINVIDQEIDSAYQNYIESIKFSKSDEQKIKIYNNLIRIAEENKDYENLLIYVDELYNTLFIDSDKKELKLLSIEYNKRLSRYDYLITEIQNMLNQSLFEDKRMFLTVELAKSYYNLEDYEIAEELFRELVDTYSKKNETAEAYFYLAKINIANNFNLEKIKELYEKSKSERSSSKHGKLSKQLIKKVETLEDIIYEYNLSISEENEDKTDQPAPDSLLFDMAQIYYFDFNQIDSSISKHSKLIYNFPESKFAPKSTFVLSILDSANNKWSSMMRDGHINFNIKDKNDLNYSDISYSDEYYNALNLLEHGFHDKAYPILKESNLINNKESLFYLGYINEVYVQNIEEMLMYYIDYLNEGSNEDKKNQVKEKLSSYYYLFGNKLNYYHSKNNLINCFKGIDPSDSLSVDVNDCYQNLEEQNPGYTIDSLKVKITDMQILNQSWTTFNKNMEFIENTYTIDLDSADSLLLMIKTGVMSNSEIDENVMQINQLSSYIDMFSKLVIKEENSEPELEYREDIPEKTSMPFDNLNIEGMDLEKLKLLKQ